MQNSDKREITIWSVNLILAWLLLLAITIADFGASIVPILETGNHNDIARDLGASLFILFLFIPPFVITEEVNVCKRSYIANPALRPLYAFSLSYLAIVAFAQFSFVLFESVFMTIIALVIGRLGMCFFFRKHPMDRTNA